MDEHVTKAGQASVASAPSMPFGSTRARDTSFVSTSVDSTASDSEGSAIESQSESSLSVEPTSTDDDRMDAGTSECLLPAKDWWFQ